MHAEDLVALGFETDACAETATLIRAKLTGRTAVRFSLLMAQCEMVETRQRQWHFDTANAMIEISQGRSTDAEKKERAEAEAQRNASVARVRQWLDDAESRVRADDEVLRARAGTARSSLATILKDRANGVRLAGESIAELERVRAPAVDRIAAYRALAMAYAKETNDDLDKAIAAAEKALAIACAELPFPYPATAEIANRLASLRLRADKSEEAVEPLTVALTSARMLPDLKQLELVYENGAQIYEALGRSFEAAQWARNAAELAVLGNPPRHPASVEAVVEIATDWIGGDDAAVCDYYRLVTSDEPRFVIAPDHPALFQIIGKWAEAEARRGHDAEAVALRKRSLALHERFGLPPAVAALLERSKREETQATLDQLSDRRADFTSSRDEVVTLKLSQRIAELTEKLAGTQSSSTALQVTSYARDLRQFGDAARADEVVDQYVKRLKTAQKGDTNSRVAFMTVASYFRENGMVTLADDYLARAALPPTPRSEPVIASSVLAIDQRDATDAEIAQELMSLMAQSRNFDAALRAEGDRCRTTCSADDIETLVKTAKTVESSPAARWLLWTALQARRRLPYRNMATEAEIVSRLAGQYQFDGRLGVTTRLLRESVDALIAEHSFPSQLFPELAKKLADAYVVQGRTNDAVSLARRLLDASGGRIRVDIATAKEVEAPRVTPKTMSIAQLRSRRETLAVQVLKTPPPPTTLQSVNDAFLLAQIDRELGLDAEADAILLRVATDDAARSLVPPLVDVNDLAKLRETRMAAMAEVANARRSLKQAEAVHGDNAPELAEPIERLAKALRNANAFDEAADLDIRRALLREWRFGEVTAPLLVESKGQLDVVQMTWQQLCDGFVMNSAVLRSERACVRAQLKIAHQQLVLGLQDTEESILLDRSSAQRQSRLLSLRKGTERYLEIAYRASLTDPVSNEKLFALETVDYLRSRQSSASKPQFDMKTVQSALGADDALIAFFVDDTSYAWVVRKDRVEWRSIEATSESLRRAIQWLHGFLDPTAVDVNLTPFPAAESHELYLTLFAPILSLLDGVTTIYLMPDGPIYDLPVATLIAEPPQRPSWLPSDPWRPSWLGARFGFVFLSPTDPLAAVAYAHAPRPFIGFGAPNLPKSTKLDPLPQAIGELQRMAAASQVSADSAHVGDAMTVHALAQTDLSQYRVIAFATHAQLNVNEDNDVREPALVFTPDGDDGLLTSSAVSALHIAADLVILSACRTAKGPGGSDEDSLSGLTAAFLHAGARTVLGTQWRVDSESAEHVTAAILEVARKEKLAMPLALREAIKSVTTESATARFRAPALWGPFILISRGILPKNSAAD